MPRSREPPLVPPVAPAVADGARLRSAWPAARLDGGDTASTGGGSALHRRPGAARSRPRGRTGHQALEMRRSEQQVVGHQRGLLQHVAQLADVAAPRLLRQQIQRVGTQALVRQAAAPRDVFGQRLDQRIQVSHALAQRRQADGQDIEAVVQSRGRCGRTMRAVAAVAAHTHSTAAPVAAQRSTSCS